MCRGYQMLNIFEKEPYALGEQRKTLCQQNIYDNFFFILRILSLGFVPIRDQVALGVRHRHHVWPQQVGKK